MSNTFKIINGDIEYDVRGRPQMVTGHAKASQDVHELTVENIDDIGFGMGILELIGTTQDPTFVPAQIKSKIVDGVDRFVRILHDNQRDVRSDNELVENLVHVSASPITSSNKTDFKFSYAVNTKEGNKISKKGTIS